MAETCIKVVEYMYERHKTMVRCVVGEVKVDARSGQFPVPLMFLFDSLVLVQEDRDYRGISIDSDVCR